MHFLFITGPLHTGGAERVLLDLLQHIDYRQHRVTLCQIVGGGFYADEIPGTVQRCALWLHYGIGFSAAWHSSLRIGFNGLIRRRARRLLRESYDVAISFLEGAPLRVHALTMPQAKRHYSWVHCDLEHFPYEQAQFRSEQEELAAYNAMDGIICVSHDTERAFHRRFPGCTTPTRTIFNPVDIAKIHTLSDAYELTKRPFTVLCLGRLSAQKRFDRAIRVAALLRQKAVDIHFLIMGQGELQHELARQIRELGLADRVQLRPFTPNPFPQLRAADLLLICSEAEGFSLVLCEALALGVPVVSTRTAGPTEIIEHNHCGLLCAHDDAAIAEAILSMHRSPELRQRCIRAGYERVRDFDVHHAIQELYTL